MPKKHTIIIKRYAPDHWTAEEVVQKIQDMGTESSFFIDKPEPGYREWIVTIEVTR